MPPVPPPQPPQEGATTLTLPQALQRALAACQRGEWAEAERVCRLVLDARPGHFDALHLLGMIAVQTQRFPEAVDLLSKALAANPRSAPAHATRAAALRQLGRHAEALESYDRAIEIAPDSADIHVSRGTALSDLGRRDEALESYGRAIALEPGHALAHYNRGLALHDLKRNEEALQSCERAIALDPGLADAHNNRGVVLRDLGRREEALESYERAIALNPGSPEAHNNRGVVLRELMRHEEARQSYERSIALRPGFAQAHYNRGNALGDLHRHAEALQGYDRAIALQPGYVDAHIRRGVALRDLKRHAEALESYERALQINPDFDWLYGAWLNARMQVCEWDGLADQLDRLALKIERREKAANPFPVLALSGSPAIQRMAAEIWVADKHAVAHALPEMPKRPVHDRIRIGYFSADFFEHATSYLMAELLERHDKAAFEVTAFSFGPDTRDEMRGRVAAAVDRFIDVRGQSDEAVAMLARELEIDIAVDLKGFTEDSRTNLFALRAAPVQVSYLGYPGTMGAPFIDYLVADATLIPEEHQRHYAERVVYLPDSYQVNDSRRRIAAKAFTREELGLPQDGVVFCSFNNNYKITPEVFDRWMRILRDVGNSVLWLLQDNEWAANNLRKEAVRRGIDASRLVFARRMPLAEHLARHRLADLFLDTLPYNAHTTASDALWAGVPVLTCLGETFAGRVGASLLNAIRLPELITSTPEQYEAVATGLANDPARLRELRQRLADNRLATPLFDARLFARHIEAAYSAMYEKYREGLAPGNIRVPG